MDLPLLLQDAVLAVQAAQLLSAPRSRLARWAPSTWAWRTQLRTVSRRSPGRRPPFRRGPLKGKLHGVVAELLRLRLVAPMRTTSMPDGRIVPPSAQVSPAFGS